MTATPMPTPDRDAVDLRAAIAFAGLMLAIPLGAKLATMLGWADGADLAGRAPMAILGAFFMFTGNAVPKRLAPLAGLRRDPARTQAFRRFAGWTWVLTGLAFGLAWLFLPTAAARTVTLIVVPVGMALIAYRWLGLRNAAPPSA